MTLGETTEDIRRTIIGLAPYILEYMYHITYILARRARVFSKFTIKIRSKIKPNIIYNKFFLD